jgi:hypothetical protein
MAYIYNMADTWADAGTTFTAIKMNVTDTASNAGSLLLDLQVGGASQFRVAKNGTVTSAARADFGDPITSGGVNALRATGLALGNTSEINWRSASTWAAGSTDLILARDAANALAQRNGVNEQAFRVYNTYTDGSNYERARIAWVSNQLTIGTESAGTGSVNRTLAINAQNGSIAFTAGFNQCWTINSASHFVTGVDNAFDIGASGGQRPRRLFLGGGSLTGTQADSSLTISPTWNTTGTPTAVLLNVTDTASNAASLLMDLQVGGVSKFSVTKSTVNSTVIQLNSNGGIANIEAFGNSLTLAGNGGHNVVLPAANFQRAGVGYGFFLGTGTTANSPVLYGNAQEANHTIAQRNGTNAQTFRVYNTFTDASNFERLSISGGGASSFRIAAEASGTGSSRSIALDTALGGGGIVFATGGTSRWAVSSSAGGGHFIASTDNTFDIGSSGANRPRNLYMGSWIRMATTTVASLPAAATAGAGARMFVTDASAPTFGSAVAGGGAVTVPVYSTGSAWNVG